MQTCPLSVSYTHLFFVEPDIWDLLDKVRDMAAGYGAEPVSYTHLDVYKRQISNGI